MTKAISKEGFGDLKLLLVIGRFFCLLPPYKCDKRFILKFYKIRSSIVFLIFLSCCISSWYQTIKWTFTLKNSVITTTLYLQLLIMTLSTTIILIAISSIFNLKKFEKFLKLFEEINTYSHLKGKAQKCRNIILIEMFVFHIIFANFMAFDLYASIVNSAWFDFNILLIDIELYFVLVLMLFIFNCTLWSRNRYKEIIIHLEEMVRWNLHFRNCYIASSKHINKVNSTVFGDNVVQKNMLEIRMVFSKMYELINLFNKIFGWEILLTFALLAIVILGMVEIQLHADQITFGVGHLYALTVFRMIVHVVSTYLSTNCLCISLTYIFYLLIVRR